MELEYGPATAKDLPQMVELLGVLFTDEAEFLPNAEKQRRALEAILANPQTGTIFVAREGKRVVAMASLLFTAASYNAYMRGDFALGQQRASQAVSNGVVGSLGPGTVLAISDDLGALPGTPTREPVFGLAAKWVPVELRHQAELAGATVVDRSSVITTHLAEIVRQQAGRLLGRQDVKALVDMVRMTDPAIIDELLPNLSLSEIQRVLQLLLDENVAIRDLVRILDVLSERARATKDPETLVEAVRGALGPAISAASNNAAQLAPIEAIPCPAMS